MPEDPIEVERQRNKREMDERCERIAEWMASEKFPMTPDNPLYDATDDEVRAYIRKRREAFQPKLEAYLAEKKRLNEEYAANRAKR